MAHKTVLIVDDDSALRRMMSSLLDRLGYQSVTAKDGKHALQQYEDIHPDVILLDVAMPGMSGFEVAMEIRKREEGQQHTPIVILTAYAQSYFVSLGFEAAIDGYVTKPVSPKQIKEYLNSLAPLESVSGDPAPI